MLFVCVGCEPSPTKQHERPKSIRPVLTVVAAEAQESASRFTGSVESRFQSNLSFRILGRLVARKVDPGDSVQKGQVLAILDATEPTLAVRSSESALAIAVAEKNKAAKTFARQKQLRINRATSESEYEDAKKAAESATSLVAEAQAALDKSREELTYASLVAELDGVVTEVFAEIGETVRPGQIILTVADPKQLEAVIDSSDEFAERVQMGDKFAVALPPLNIETAGEVREIGPQADAETKTRRIRITLPSSPEEFRLGATINAFPVNNQTTGIRLPTSAILERDKSTFVWVVDESESLVRLIQVEVADRNETSVLVQSGANVGDRVVIAGVNRLQEGQQIRIGNGALQ